jgi:hypothetical protein
MVERQVREDGGVEVERGRPLLDDRDRRRFHHRVRDARGTHLGEEALHVGCLRRRERRRPAFARESIGNRADDAWREPRRAPDAFEEMRGRRCRSCR